MNNCQSKRKALLKQTQKLTEKTSLKIDSTAQVFEKKDSIKTVKIAVKKKEQTNEGNVVIKGKVDSISKDFKYNNVVNGDTLSSITIHGNADFEIKNNWKNKQTTIDSVKADVSTNLVAKYARKAVAKGTIKDIAAKVTEAKKDIKTTGFSLPIYIIGGVGLLVALLLFWFFGKPKKN